MLPEGIFEAWMLKGADRGVSSLSLFMSNVTWGWWGFHLGDCLVHCTTSKAGPIGSVIEARSDLAEPTVIPDDLQPSLGCHLAINLNHPALM